jgi:prepilin-type N-terminal cleavage/methylation domain-containing protein
MERLNIKRSRISDGGMSLVELLTVIAIISLLAAIIFPTMSAARRKARESSCMTNMFQISTAIREFELDQHRYPDFIAGPVAYVYPSGAVVYNPNVYSPNASDPSPGNGEPVVVPLDQSKGTIGSTVVALYPEYIRSINGLVCPNSNLNGAGTQYKLTDRVMDPMGPPDTTPDPGALANQYQPYNLLVSLGVTNATRSDARPSYMKDSSDERLPYYLYAMSNYDIQLPGGTSEGDSNTHVCNYQVHYSTIWSNAAVGTAGLERQLRWRNPPADTIVSWCSLHRDLSGNDPTSSSFDTVLFLDGRTKRLHTVGNPDGAYPGFTDWTKGWKNPEPS